METGTQTAEALTCPACYEYEGQHVELEPVTHELWGQVWQCQACGDLYEQTADGPLPDGLSWLGNPALELDEE